MHVRPGSNNAHVAQHYIDELRNFIDAGVAQEVPDSCDPVIVYLSLLLVCLPVHNHGPELNTQKRFTAFAYSLLHKKDWTPGIKPYQNGNQGEKPRTNK